MSKSKYAEMLRARGFREMPSIEVDGVEQNSIYRPMFCMISQLNMTSANDEVGGRWMVQDVIDLSDLGFSDASEAAQAVLRALEGFEFEGIELEIPKQQ